MYFSVKGHTIYLNAIWECVGGYLEHLVNDFKAIIAEQEAKFKEGIDFNQL